MMNGFELDPVTCVTKWSAAAIADFRVLQNTSDGFDSEYLLSVSSNL